MASTPDDYRRTIYRDLMLPSGHVFMVKTALTLFDFFTADDLPIPGTPGETPEGLETPENTAKLKRCAERGFVNGVVQPKLTGGYDADGEPIMVPGKLHIAELAPRDYETLLNTLMETAGLKVEVATEIAAFCEDQERETPGSPGGEVPLSPLVNHEDVFTG